MIDSDLKSKAFQAAQLKSEETRVVTLLLTCAGLLAVILVRGVLLLIQGRHGQVWQFAALLIAFMAYEAVWLTLIRRHIAANGTISDAQWRAGIIIESLLPAIALVMEIHTAVIGPQRTLTSSVILVYFLFIILSILHLNPSLSRLAGIVAAIEYAAIAVYAFEAYPESAAGGRLVAYGTSMSVTALLLIGGFAAGEVTRQLRGYVLAALRDVENRAKVEQFEHDLDIARSIQQGLLPKESPNIDGFDIAGWNRPADQTGGDYYDWQRLPDGCAAVTVADVTGHGIGSALCMAVCRAYARAGFVIEPDLGTFMCRLNRLMHEDLPTEKFVTFAAGLLNPHDASLRLMSAGHGPLLFYSSAEDDFRVYDAQGLPLGLLPKAPYGSPHVLKFGRGDILLLVTDGFIEWANSDDEDFGQDRLKQVIRSFRKKPASEIISALYSAVVKFAGPMPQLDDLTALVVKRV